MESKETLGNLSHLAKTALPIIGRVGTVAGGLVSLLIALNTISSDLVIVVGGVLLVVAIVTSAIVVFHSTTRVVEEQSVKSFTYSQRARTIATIVMVAAGILLGVFGVGVTLNKLAEANRQAGRGPVNKSALLTQTPNPKLGTTIAMATQVRSTSIPTNPPATPTPTATFTATPTPGTPTRTPTFTPVAVEQMTDVTQLNKLGSEALKAINLARAYALFSRALQIDATNAQSQLGLGITYFYLNNHQPAITPLTTALKLDPKLVDAHAYLGFIYDYRLDFVRARAEYDEFLRIAPKDNPLRDDVEQRNKLQSRSQPPPTLTPFMTPTSTPTSENK
jgi:hypothetical protein